MDLPDEAAAEILLSGGLENLDDDTLLELRTNAVFYCALRGLRGVPNERRRAGYRVPVAPDKVGEVMASIEKRFHLLFEVIEPERQVECKNCRGGQRFKNPAKCKHCRGRGWTVAL